MGIVFRPRDLLKGRKLMIERGLKDIVPNGQEEVLQILRNWEGEPSEQRLIFLLGEEKTRKLKEMLNL